MSEIKVNSIKGVGSTDAAITINNSDGTCTANLTNKPNRNLIINGAMQVAQRGTSSTASGYGTVDRMQNQYSVGNENVTQEQVDVASGTTPYTEGFRKAYKQTNGNQTSGVGANYYIYLWTTLEAQDIANSGWNYTDPNSFITLSFWIKSSVAQNFYGTLTTDDGTAQNYVYETGSLTADTWTKITKKIPGNSNLQFDNNANSGLKIAPYRAYDGTDRTASMSLNTWGAYSGSSRSPDATATWYTTNDATIEITGLQLEVSDHASSFEFLSFADELRRCKRYFNNFGATTATGTSATYMLIQGGYARFGGANSIALQRIFYDVEMRTTPTIKYGRNSTNDDFAVMRWSSDGSNPVVYLGSTEGSNRCGFQITRYNAGSGTNPVTETYNDGDSFTHQISKFRADAEL